MKVKVLHYTPYEVLMTAIRISRASVGQKDTLGNELGLNDKRLLEKIIKLKHGSVLEHLNYTLLITGISRALLQQLVRHRHVSFTVESTRFTLKKIAEKARLEEMVEELSELVDDELFHAIMAYLYDILHAFDQLPNDQLKYAIPEFYPTRLVMTTNARELAHIIHLRSQKNVLPEFRQLAFALFEAVKEIHPELWEMLEKEGLMSEGGVFYV